MHVSWTFSRYFSRQFLYAVGVAFLASLAIIFLADFVELLRRTSTKEEVSIGIVLSMALLRLPSLGWEVMPFAVLIGGMASLLRLNRSQELVVARAAGVPATTRIMRDNHYGWFEKVEKGVYGLTQCGADAVATSSRVLGAD